MPDALSELVVPRRPRRSLWRISTHVNFWRKTLLTESYHAEATATSDYDFTASWDHVLTRDTSYGWDTIELSYNGTLEAHRDETFTSHFDIDSKVTTFNTNGTVASVTGTQTWDRTATGTSTWDYNAQQEHWPGAPVDVPSRVPRLYEPCGCGQTPLSPTIIPARSRPCHPADPVRRGLIERPTGSGPARGRMRDWRMVFSRGIRSNGSKRQLALARLAEPWHPVSETNRGTRQQQLELRLHSQMIF